MWVRPAYHPDVWPAGDSRRLINLKGSPRLDLHASAEAEGA
jgi:hypothetical protein